MTCPALSLNLEVSWSRLIELLGVNHTSTALPQSILCPRCQHSAHIFADSYCGGQWFVCPSCQQSCDMLELAAWTWDLSITAAVGKLVSSGMPLGVGTEEIARYERLYSQQRKRVTELWRRAQQNCHTHHNTRTDLLQKLKISVDLNAKRWLEGPGEMLGILDWHDIEHFYAPGTFETKRWDKHGGGQRRVNCNVDRIFCGRAWSDVLMIPFYDFPDRIVSWQFVGREANFKQDVALRHAINGREERSGNDPGVREGGLAHHPALWQLLRPHDRLIVTGDLYEYLRLQLRNFESSLLPLPLLCWTDRQHSSGYTCRTRQAWQQFHTYGLILWLPQLDASALRQLLKTRGQVSLWGFGNRKLQDWLRKMAPADVMSAIRKEAQPWQNGLAAVLDQADDSVVEELLYRLRLDDFDLEELKRRCRPSLRARLEQRAAEHPTHQSVIYGRYQIVENDNGMEIGQRARSAQQTDVMCNARIRLNQIVHYRDTAEIFYRGTIWFRGEELDFSAPKEDFERQPLEWLRNWLINRDKGLLTFQRRWQTDILSILGRFHQPEVVTGFGSAGWNEEERAFVFPRYLLRDDGRIVTDAAVHFPRPHPSRNFLLPADITPELISGPAEKELAAIYWGVIAAVLANVLAPAYEQPTTGIGLYGNAVVRVGRAMAAAAGCVVKHPGSKGEYTQRSGTQELLRAEYDQNWPIYVPSPSSHARRQSWSDWLMTNLDEPRNCLAELDPAWARVLGIAHNWLVIRTETPQLLSSACLAAIGRIIPAYLQDLCRRRMVLALPPREPSHWYDEVLYDISDVVSRNRGHRNSVLAARDLVAPVDSTGRSLLFVGLLRALLDMRTFQIVPEGHEPRRNKHRQLLRLNTGQIRVPKQVLATTLDKKYGAVLDADRVSAALIEEKIPVCEDEDYWYIDEAWWSRTLRSLERTSGLRVVG